MLFSFPQFFYGWLTFFSAMSIFDDWYIFTFNLIFTSGMITYIGVYEQDLRFQKLRDLNSPQVEEEQSTFDEQTISKLGIEKIHNIEKNYQHLYYLTQKGIYFSLKGLFVEILLGLFHSMVICAIVSLIYQRHIIDIEGRCTDHWNVSITLYSCLIFIVNIVYILRLKSINWLIPWIVILSAIVPLYIFMSFYDRFGVYEVRYSLYMTIKTPTYYLTIFMSVYLIIGNEVLTNLWAVRITPNLVDYFRWLSKKGLITKEEYFQKSIINKIKQFTNPIQALLRWKSSKNGGRSLADEIERMIQRKRVVNKKRKKITQISRSTKRKTNDLGEL